MFLTRLFSAFDTNPNSKGVNFKEFIEGLSVFMKGTPDEKLERELAPSGLWIEDFVMSTSITGAAKRPMLKK